MTLLILGLLLWIAVHVWKRVAPAHRASFGEKGKGIVAIGSVIAIVLMVIGYGRADGMVFWGRNGVGSTLNNLLMIFGVYLFAASGKGTRITRWVRHPQLTAVVVWAIAHLLVNGDTPSFVLFGGLGLWAAAEMVILNRANGTRGAYHAPPIKSEGIALVATLVVFAVIVAIHTWLGYHLFG